MIFMRVLHKTSEKGIHISLFNRNNDMVLIRTEGMISTMVKKTMESYVILVLAK